MAIFGAHILLYSSEPEALRATLRDAFGFKSVDAGGGWLIFALPPAELGVHPGEAHHELSFMCDDIQRTASDLRSKGVEIKGEPKEERFGTTIMTTLPGGVNVLLYEPRHPIAIGI